MTTMVRHSGGALSGLLDWFELNRPTGLSDLTHYIAVESFTDDGKFVVRADLPGVDPDKDIDVRIDGDVLTIHGERHEEENENGHSEVRYGSFTRSVRLPQGSSPVDISARYDAGVLEVSVPVGESPAEPVKIAVQRTGGGAR
jgi:HSP20 family protein